MSKETVQTPGPIELYILAAGLLLGVLLGPAVLGRVAPTAHASLFGGGPATQQLIEYEEETAAMVAALQATGVTPDAVSEQLELRSMRGEAIRQARKAVMDRNAMITVNSAFILLGIIMLAEAIGRRSSKSVREQRWQLWLMRSRYLIAALGCAVMVAHPSILVALPAGAIAIALGLIGITANLLPTTFKLKTPEK